MPFARAYRYDDRAHRYADRSLQLPCVRYPLSPPSRARSIIFVVTTCSIINVVYYHRRRRASGLTSNMFDCFVCLSTVVVCLSTVVVTLSTVVVCLSIVVLALSCSPLASSCSPCGRRYYTRPVDGIVVFAVRTASSCSTSSAGILTRASVTLLSEEGGWVDSTGAS
ncbi:hypothetical protein BD626DRAFT_478578 [Schizophyllum amplum]|uniref:Uncharacterized protein n=1 Tax=Schizophyllum amplum TaxID=97359 RepID=A0A550CRD4_9AGAR|nr:hypothetical protein BD626DRAFT_478578 [Auriculariopsis ampla]